MHLQQQASTTVTSSAVVESALTVSQTDGQSTPADEPIVVQESVSWRSIQPDCQHSHAVARTGYEITLLTFIADNP